MSTVYEFTGGNLTPIDVSGVQLGERVKQAQHGDFGIVVSKQDAGYSVIMEHDCSIRHSQRVNALSPMQRITPMDPPEFTTNTEYEALIAKHQQHKLDEAARREEEKKQKAIDKAKYVAELKESHPWAVDIESGKSRHARAAANLREELKRAFPKVKFSVKSESYSGGNSVNVKWSLGPTIKEVEAIANKYQDGNFDGMEDIHRYDNSAYGEAVSIVLGRVKYVFCERSMTDAVRDALQRGLAELQNVEYVNDQTQVINGAYANDGTAGTQAYRLFVATPFPVDFNGKLKVVSNHDREGDPFMWARVQFWDADGQVIDAPKELGASIETPAPLALSAAPEAVEAAAEMSPTQAEMVQKLEALKASVERVKAESAARAEAATEQWVQEMADGVIASQAATRLSIKLKLEPGAVQATANGVSGTQTGLGADVYAALGRLVFHNPDLFNVQIIQE